MEWEAHERRSRIYFLIEVFLIFLLLRKDFIKDFGIFSPVLIDLHPQCEEYLFIEYFFEDDPRIGSYGLDFFASFTNHDHLLRISFHIDVCLYREHGKRLLALSSLFFYLCHFDIACIGNLITEFEKELFADDLLYTQFCTLIRIIVRLIEEWSLGKEGSNTIEEFVESCLCNRINTQIDILLWITLILHVLLRLDAQNRLLDTTEYLVDADIFFSIRSSRIEKANDDICLPQ